MVPFLLTGIVLLLAGLIYFAKHSLNRRRKDAEGRRELETSLNLLVSHVKDYAIFFVDPEGRVMSWNEGAQQIKGYTEQEIVGQPISVFYTDEEARSGEPFMNLQRAAQEGRYESVGLRKRKDGTLFHADVVFTPMYDEKRNLKGFIKITRDISEQKKAEKDILSSLHREKELNELKSRFVTLASHEFKTPLSVILSSASLIEKYPASDMQDKRVKHVHRIKSNVNYLKQILNGFLSLEKLEGGLVHNHPVETDLVYLVKELVQELEEALKEGQQIELYTNGLARPFSVDPFLLRNILINLLSNASKYSGEGSAIDCVLTYTPDAVRIDIRDRGIGIPQDEQAQLFERFFRAKNTTGIPGTGLGLSIVSKYLELMGGIISLTSTPGEGSVFSVTLPL